MARALTQIPDLARLEVAALVEIYDLLSKTDNSFVGLNDLRVALDLPIGGLLGVFISNANSHQYFFIDSDNDYSISNEGLRRVVEGMSNSESDISEYLRIGPSWVMTRLENFDHSTLDNWTPLPIDRGAPQYMEMIEASETALSEIEGSNGYAEDNPEERNSIVSAIRGTLNQIKESNPPRTIVLDGLLQPLKFIASKFAGAAIGEIAKAAVLAITKWLGSF